MRNCKSNLKIGLVHQCCTHFYYFFFRDILLGLMKRLIKRRASNLKVLITSATLDGEKVSNFFSNCPVLTVPGKLHPVEILYSKERPKSYIESSLKTALGKISVLVYCFTCCICLFCFILLVLFFKIFMNLRGMLGI